MPIKKLTRLSILLVLLLIFACYKAGAEESLPLQVRVNKGSVNIRTDSTVNSEIICNITKGTNLEVVKEFYGWYKIRLPKNAPSFIRKDFVRLIAGMPGEVIKERVNIRLKPKESSPILGRANKNEVINILGEKGGWYKIEPTNNCFGWVNMEFLAEVPAIKKQEPTQEIVIPADKVGPEMGKQDIAPVDLVMIEGIVKPYGRFFKRITTHKLITIDNKVFLLKGDKPALDAVNYRKVRISGTLSNLPRQKYPLIEIKGIEVVD